MKRKSAPGLRRIVANQADVPHQPKDVPTHCPLFPTVPTRSVGKVILQAIEYDRDGEKHHQTIVHPRVAPEMDEADIAAIAGGGEYYVAIQKNDGSGQIISHRKVEIFGPPKEFDDDDDDDGKRGRPTVIDVPGAEPIIIPAGVRGSDQAAYIAQQQQIRLMQRQAEAGSQGLGSIIGPIMSAQNQAAKSSTELLIAMMNRASDPAQTQALAMAQTALNNAATEKATLITTHGQQVTALTAAHANELHDLRVEHAKAVDKARDDLSKSLDENRRLVNQLETRVADARLEEKRRADEETNRLRAEINRLNIQLVAIERARAQDLATARSSSDMVEIAKLAAPAVSSLVGQNGTGGIVDKFNKLDKTVNDQILPAINALPQLAVGLPAMVEDAVVRSLRGPVRDTPADPPPLVPAPAPGAGVVSLASRKVPEPELPE